MRVVRIYPEKPIEYGSDDIRRVNRPDEFLERLVKVKTVKGKYIDHDTQHNYPTSKQHSVLEERKRGRERMKIVI